VKWREQVDVLIEKARQDLYMMRAHQDDANVSDEMWGFHAQQAVEKLFKAMLARREIRYPFTHHLRTLAELLDNAGAALPECFEPLLDLTPFAAELRYSVMPREEGEKPLDRLGIAKLAAMLEKHVSDAVSG
jgi:HEPN domain-containing protein